MPSGASFLSIVVGITPSTNGDTDAFRSMCESWKARSAYAGEKQSSTEPVWCSCRFFPGIAVKSGSSDIATLIFTTPERVFQRSMSVTKSAGRSADGMRSRNPIFGCTHVTPIGARSSVPSSSTTPWKRPPEVSIDFTRAFVRISAPKDSADRLIESETPPMPPCW